MYIILMKLWSVAPKQHDAEGSLNLIKTSSKSHDGESHDSTSSRKESRGRSSWKSTMYLSCQSIFALITFFLVWILSLFKESIQISSPPKFQDVFEAWSCNVACACFELICMPICLALNLITCSLCFLDELRGNGEDAWRGKLWMVS